ncbi:MAG: phosphatidate cytidylyltransferase [Gammaproteobacteria bacterium]|nr:phosphatidate cytidylyltransferase [Gammaproteobacteria bacterium]MBU1656098.1 phosphatidate cytidylyltransferase [Gammaproteobacteria bacterium]MBU1962183.1 phosphatidate cytidylyltransferase [Gammaproteobacteria bacterium]
MLKQRILTAAILAPAVIAAILLLPNQVLALLLALVVLMGAFEWARLSGLASPLRQGVYVLLMALALVAAEWLRPHQEGLFLLLACAVLWWLAVLVGLVLAKPAEPLPPDAFSLSQAVSGFLVLVPSWVALVELHANPKDGPALLLFLMVLIWGADSGAYFTGRRWGKTKLAPAISPGKTREGVYGASVGALLCALFFIAWAPLGALNTLAVLSLCLTAALFSVVGDLFESLVKRRRGVKDSGRLLPGHGGVLDRIDSLTSAGPIFLFGLWLAGVA